MSSSIVPLLPWERCCCYCPVRVSSSLLFMVAVPGLRTLTTWVHNYNVVGIF